MAEKPDLALEGLRRQLGKRTGPFAFSVRNVVADPVRFYPATFLNQIRRDLAALDVPGLSVDAESRGNSLFTTIRLESAGKIDMSMKKTDGMFEFFLMSGSGPDDGDGPVSFQIEFFCE